MSNLVSSAIDHIGTSKVGKEFGIRPSAAQKWRDNGCLPQTELAGLTQYAAGLEKLTGGKYRAENLIAETRAVWEARWRKRGRSN